MSFIFCCYDAFEKKLYLASRHKLFYNFGGKNKILVYFTGKYKSSSSYQ